MTVILVRHGETKLNKQVAGESAERIRGWRDVPLDAKGVESAQEQAKRMCKRRPPLDRIYSSPLVRAKSTADEIAKTCHVPVIETKALMPWHLGGYTGRLVDEVITPMNLLVADETASPPAGEPFKEFRLRFLSFLAATMHRAQRTRETILLVTHTRNVQLVKAWQAAGARPNFKINVERMNDYSDEHAPGEALELKVA